MPQRAALASFMSGVILICGATLSRPAAAQSIEGRTVEQPGARPIGLVEIELANSAGRRLTSATSDWDGRFRFGPLAAGHYVLRAARFGYAVTSTTVVVALDAPTEVQIELAADAVAIGGVDVDVRRGPDIQHTATYNGLYTRRSDTRWANLAGPNRVYVRSDLEDVSGLTVLNFIRRHAPPSLGRGGLLSTAPPPTPGAPWRVTQGCQPHFMERGGIPLPNWMVEGILARAIGDFEGLEMYSLDHEAPLGLRPLPPSGCGIVVIWPRRKPGERE